MKNAIRLVVLMLGLVSDLRSTSRSDASGSGWWPDAYVQSKNGMRTKRKVTSTRLHR